MKRWLTHGVIAVYLGALSWGIVSHTVSFGTGAHPVMYFLVWDMFCGWSSWEGRIHVIGEGASGRYYELAPAPWGEIIPFGSIGRRHYDYLGNHSPRFARNAIRHTKHEPITRVIVVEENWPKKYNLPDELWGQRFEGPKEPHRYYQVRHVYTPDGMLVRSYPTFLNLQAAWGVSQNPRLHAEVRRSQPFFSPVYRNRSRGTFAPGADPIERPKSGSLLGD